MVFGALEDPLEWLLDVLEIQGGWKGKGPCLAYFLIQGLQLWTKEHPADCQVRQGVLRCEWSFTSLI